ncbi:hypothetical protein ONZ45_g1709 [Pleurotus djamor]|nr:hypothetical protein ONZ45_g1709 [Pleurotus djamor]
MLIFLFISLLLTSSLADVLRNFQVTQPVLIPKNVKSCTIKVLQYATFIFTSSSIYAVVLRRDFAFSFGLAEVVQLVPPTDCGRPGTWSAISLNFTVTSNGTQFDRLGIFTFKNVEIWRTSTPEPTRGDGIVWTYIKDVTHYTPLFKEPGPLILQLDNLIQPGLDGIYSTTLHATFYASSSRSPPAEQAHSIIPLSTRLNDTGNDASVPPGFSINAIFPRNTVKVFAELFASGNGLEESWVDIPPDITSGNGPFREVRLLIDDRVAGIAFPYAIIFTGGFVPSVWRPIAAYGALDLPTYFIDVTPFVPLLVDGLPHNITIDVASAEQDHAIEQNWYVSGNLQIVTDASSRPTKGKVLSYSAEPFARSSVEGRIEGEGSVDFNVKATRKLHVESVISSGSGKTVRVQWSQNLEYTNAQVYRENGTVQTLRQTSSGKSVSLHNARPVVNDVFSYPLNIDFKYLTPDLQHWNFSIDHTYKRVLTPHPFLISSNINSRQSGAGFYNRAPTGNFGNGTNDNAFSYVDGKGNTYTRQVKAAFNNITLDRVGGSLAP